MARPQFLKAGSITDDLFNIVDKDHDGVISRSEFRTALKGHLLNVQPMGQPIRAVATYSAPGTTPPGTLALQPAGPPAGVLSSPLALQPVGYYNEPVTRPLSGPRLPDLVAYRPGEQQVVTYAAPPAMRQRSYSPPSRMNTNGSGMPNVVLASPALSPYPPAASRPVIVHGGSMGLPLPSSSAQAYHPGFSTQLPATLRPPMPMVTTYAPPQPLRERSFSPSGGRILQATIGPPMGSSQVVSYPSHMMGTTYPEGALSSTVTSSRISNVVSPATMITKTPTTYSPKSVFKVASSPLLQVDSRHLEDHAASSSSAQTAAQADEVAHLSATVHQRENQIDSLQSQKEELQRRLDRCNVELKQRDMQINQRDMQISTLARQNADLQQQKAIERAQAARPAPAANIIRIDQDAAHVLPTVPASVMQDYPQPVVRAAASSPPISRPPVEAEPAPPAHEEVQLERPVSRERPMERRPETAKPGGRGRGRGSRSPGRGRGGSPPVSKPPAPDPKEAEDQAPVLEGVDMDEIDQRIHQYLVEHCHLDIGVQKLRKGWYWFDKPISKKLYVKLIGPGKVVCRVGGGYKQLEQFLDGYHPHFERHT